MRATNSERCRPYLATTGLRTSVTGLVGFAFRPTERFIGTKSSLENEATELFALVRTVSQQRHERPKCFFYKQNSVSGLQCWCT